MKSNSTISLRFPKRIFLVIALAFGVLIFGCTKEECDCPTQATPPSSNPDEYYVKYEVNSSTIYLGAKMDATIRKEDSSFTTFSISQGGSWETTNWTCWERI